MRDGYKDIVISVIPALAFILIYTYFSFGYAILSGFGIGIVVYTYKYFKHKRLSTLNYLGIFGLIIQTIISLISENQMTYFIYPIISNSVYASAFGISILAKKDLISIIGKSTCKTEEIFTVLRPTFKKVSIIWLTFFTIKAVIKLVGLYSLSFESLYLISWIVGTPMTVFLLWFTYWYPDIVYSRIKKNIKSI